MSDHVPHRAPSMSDPLCDKDHFEEIYERLKLRGHVPSAALQIAADLCLGVPVEELDEEEG